MTLVAADVNEFSVETRNASPANLLFKIESLSLLQKRGIKTYKLGLFEAGGYKWKLILNFEGNESEKEDCRISAYLSIAETESLTLGWEVNAIFTFFVHNQILDYYFCYRGTTRRFNVVYRKCGFPELISMAQCSEYSLDDSCVFGAEVFVIKPQRINECLSLLNGTAKSKREWKISNFSKLENVWLSGEFFVGNHKWRAQLYPKGDHRSKDRYISIFVECVDAKSFASHQKVKADVFMSIKSIEGAHRSCHFTHCFTSSMDHWGNHEFIPITDMSSRGFFVDDCCSLETEISVHMASSVA